MSLKNYSCKNVITNYLQKYKVVTFIDLYRYLLIKTILLLSMKILTFKVYIYYLHEKSQSCG